MGIANLCIIVPVYQEKIGDDAFFSFQFLKKNASGENIFIVAPEELNIVNYQEWNWNISFFPQKYFTSVDGYTKLLLSSFFYERFQKYEYMLICQTDALLLKPVTQIIPFLELKYDYFGAPWPEGNTIYKYSFKGISAFARFLQPQKCSVGNGGFSLRNISSTIALLNEKKRYTHIWNAGEDCFFAYYGLKNSCGFKVAPLEVAYDFAVEKDAKKQISSGRLPLGIHGWKKYYPDFMAELKNDSKETY